MPTSNRVSNSSGRSLSSSCHSASFPELVVASSSFTSYKVHVGADRLSDALQALPAGWQGRYFATLDSTQDAARAAARDGVPAKTVFVADYQRAGRGRQGRSWLAAPGTALLVSIVFRDAPMQPRPWRFTSLASLALADAIQRLAPGAEPRIKWPNDLMLRDDRKVAGVLAETSWDGRELVAIVGVGVNVNSDAAALAGLPVATSLKRVTGRHIDRGELLLEFVEELDRRLQQPSEQVHADWQSRLWRRNQRLRLVDRAFDEDVVILDADL